MKSGPIFDKASFPESPQKNGPVKKNIIYKMMVGIAADKKSLMGDIPPSKNRLKMTYPAGLGALPMTVSPPPATTPENRAYLNAAPQVGTNVERYEIDVLSLKAVSMIDTPNTPRGDRLSSKSTTHQPCNPP